MRNLAKSWIKKIDMGSSLYSVTAALVVQLWNLGSVVHSHVEACLGRPCDRNPSMSSWVG